MFATSRSKRCYLPLLTRPSHLLLSSCIDRWRRRILTMSPPWLRFKPHSVNHRCSGAHQPPLASFQSCLAMTYRAPTSGLTSAFFGLGPLLASNPYSEVFNQYALLVVTPYWLPFPTLKTRPKLSVPDTYPDIVLYQDYQSSRILGCCAFYHAIAHS